jgi:hypothetical protein
MYSVGRSAGYIVSQHNSCCLNSVFGRHDFNENIWLDTNLISSKFGRTCKAEMKSSTLQFQPFTPAYGAMVLLMPIKIRKIEVVLLGPNGIYYFPTSLNQSLYKVLFQGRPFVPFLTVPSFAMEAVVAMYEVGWLLKTNFSISIRESGHSPRNPISVTLPAR